MTRINTNVSSLIAQNTLSRSNSQLQTSLTRLSTGLRINTGKDDPAGLIASEALRSDVASIEKAISNSQRANQVIATADSALGQVSSLLNDIRGLVTQAANEGALSDDEIAANQLQVDSSLEAINRISQTTQFQGRRLLDGSLDFLTSIDNVDSVTDLQIDQANLGSAGSLNVDVDISAAAARASTSAFSAQTNANTTLTFRAEANLTGFTDANTDITVFATDPGTSFEGVTVQFNADAAITVGSETAVYDSDTDTLTININNAAATTAANVVSAINDLDEFSAVNNGGAGDAIDGADAGDVAITGVTDADDLTITAATAGPDFNHIDVVVVADSTPAATPTASYDADNQQLTININDSAATALTAINTAVNNLVDFNSTHNANGDGNIEGNTNDADATANTDTSGGGLLLDDLVIELAGANGSEVFTFETGASVNQIVSAVDLVSDATGISASQSAGVLTLNSTGYGSSKFVNVEIISEGSAGLFNDNLSASRATGTDIQATVNGIAASGDGNQLSINTSSLDLSLTVTDGSSTNFSFDITGGGALFQLGPNVVSNQQARLGIRSVNTAKLGSDAGRLYELASGGTKALATDATGAAEVVEAAIDKVSSLRGRLGAFQRTTLETNIASLNDTLSNLVEAESSIRDADFAKESAALTRAQILVQSGTSVLGIANQNPQNVLSLLR